MKKTLGLSLLLWFSYTLCFSTQLAAQDSIRIYTWEEALLAPKDSVFRLDASKQKWEELPAELFTFTHLKSLDISKNKLTSLPAEMSVFKELRTLDAGKNKLKEFPVAICPLTQLKKLMLNRNYITTLPACIGYFSQLKVLDLWDNPIESLPSELSKVTSLEVVDLRGILFNQAFQDKWREELPQTKWYFDLPCKCLD
ncbi:MAG: leucine-rich repeat domain-containing protein [Fluviicola sp.]|nr:leucine-rich repeat domain-containing protein [Fluviicola sp.]